MDWAGFMSSARKSCTGRYLFFTSKGLLELGPEEAQPRDVVTVMLGCSVPVLLRKVENHYEVLGEACEYRTLTSKEQRASFHSITDIDVHGIMEGEAMEELREGTVALTKLDLQ